MKIRILYLIGAICLIVAFWACGGGDLYYPETDDLVAVEKFEKKIGPKELNAMMDSCLADAKCSAKWDSSLGRPEWTSKTKSSSSHKASSSSKEDSAASKESSSSIKDVSSAASDKSSSSKSPDPESSSSAPKESSSSKVEPESSSDVTPTSSEEEESSSSEEDPISSDESSSSEDAPEESSSSVSSSSYLPPAGTCKPDKTQAKLGEPVTWTYYPDEGTLHDKYFRWLADPEEMDMEYCIAGENGIGYGEVQPTVVAYKKPGKVTGASIRIGTDKGHTTDIECDPVFYVTVINEPYSASSSSDPEDDPPPETSTSSSSSSSSRNGGTPDIGY